MVRTGTASTDNQSQTKVKSLFTLVLLPTSNQSSNPPTRPPTHPIQAYLTQYQHAGLVTRSVLVNLFIPTWGYKRGIMISTWPTWLSWSLHVSEERPSHHRSRPVSPLSWGEPETTHPDWTYSSGARTCSAVSSSCWSRNRNRRNKTLGTKNSRKTFKK